MSLSKRMFFILIGAIIIVSALSIAAIVLGTSFLRKQSETLVGLKLEARVLSDQQTQLTQAKKDIDKYAEVEKIARSIVPQDKDQARTVRELTNIAQQSGIRISSITFPSSTLGNAAPKPASGDDKNGASTPAAPPLTQVKPAEGIKGVYVLPITLAPESGVTFDQLISFLQRLEINRRTSHVQSIGITPDRTGRITFTLTLNSYVKP